MRLLQDNLTGLNNMTYLEENYESFVEKIKTHTISIDFKKLKYINDNFGHDAGDLTIIVFARFLKKAFSESICIRRSGDEFVVITSDSVSVIINKLKTIKRLITKAAYDGELPVDFKFNCGVVENHESFSKNIYKADITMYYAKKNNYFISLYNEEILNEVVRNEGFVKYVDKLIKTEGLTYYVQKFYTSGKDATSISEIFTRGEDGNSLFDDRCQNVLLKNYRVKQIDVKNLEMLSTKRLKSDEKYIINIHFQTLTSHEYNFVSLLKEKLANNPEMKKKICLSIDVKGCIECVDSLISTLNSLEVEGVEICLDAITNTTTSSLLPLITHTNPSYLKFKREFYVDGLTNKKTNVIIRGLVEAGIALGIRPLFTAVSSEEEYKYIKSLSDHALMSGRYFESEKKLED